MTLCNITIGNGNAVEDEGEKKSLALKGPLAYHWQVWPSGGGNVHWGAAQSDGVGRIWNFWLI